jgi:hypothetical protein
MMHLIQEERQTGLFLPVPKLTSLTFLKESLHRFNTLSTSGSSYASNIELIQIIDYIDMEDNVIASYSEWKFSAELRTRIKTHQNLHKHSIPLSIYSNDPHQNQRQRQRCVLRL